MTTTELTNEQINAQLKKDWRNIRLSGFTTILDWLRAGKPEPKNVPADVRVVAKDFAACPCVVAYAYDKDVLTEIYVSKKTQKGCTSFFVWQKCPVTGREINGSSSRFATAKQAIEYIHDELIHVGKTREMWGKA